jgi:alpha-tubulin suppressor-like RCC1 family protein
VNFLAPTTRVFIAGALVLSGCFQTSSPVPFDAAIGLDGGMEDGCPLLSDARCGEEPSTDLEAGIDAGPDAGVDAGAEDACMPTEETCNGRDDDCDGSIDEDSASSCPFTGGVGACTSGRCELESCAEGFGNCNATPEDGCEVEISSDPFNCGGCGIRCADSMDCAGGECWDGVLRVDGGYRHTCALRRTGSVWCWGSNSDGQLGDGTVVSRNTPAAVPSIADASDIAVGGYHSCAVVPSGVRCWGRNTNGQLGDGSETSSSVPILVVGGASFTRITAGGQFTCGHGATGVSCWGLNVTGQLGIGSTDYQRNVPSTVDVAAATDLAAGWSFGFAVRSGRDVSSWGRNDVSQLGDGTRTTAFAPTSVATVDDAVLVRGGGSHGCAIRESGETWCWGSNDYGQLCIGSWSFVEHEPVPTMLSSSQQLALGARHMCALSSAGVVVCCGLMRRLGDGRSATCRLSPTTCADPSPAAPMGLPDVRDIGAGSDHTCAVTSSGELYCWGANDTGQLGDGTHSDRLTPVAVLGP